MIFEICYCEKTKNPGEISAMFQTLVETTIYDRLFLWKMIFLRTFSLE